MRKRLLISILIALALPFPGPHIDSYIPLGWLPFRGEFWTADWFFYLLFLGLLAIYWLATFILWTLISKIRMR